VLPRPDMVIWSSQICDNTAKSGNDLARLFDVPGYLIDHPYRPTPKEIEYHLQDLEGLIQFLEEHSGHKLNYDRLCEAVQYSKQVMETWKEINELKKAAPFPSRSIDCFLNLMVYFLLAGSKEAVTYFEQSKTEIQALVAAGKGCLPSTERYRLMLLWTVPSFALDILDWIEKEYGAVIVMDPFSSWSAGGEMDLSKPLESIAHRSFFTPGAHQQEGPMIEGIRDVVKNAQAYRVDGVINFAHLGCRQSCAIVRSLTDALKEEVGIPTVTLDCDFYDPTSVTLDEIKEKLEGFFEILEGK
ncbi:MAG: 2-hydroxyacyl-CoA dehydratase, partial [Candidatus Binatia bacterium]